MSVLESNEFKATTKTMVVGGTYLTKKHGRVAYLGRYPFYTNTTDLMETKEDGVMKYHSTVWTKKDWFKKLNGTGTTYCTFASIKECVSATPHPDTEIWVKKLLQERRLNGIVERERHYVRTKEELAQLLQTLRDREELFNKQSLYLLNEKGVLTYLVEFETECVPMFFFNSTERSKYNNFTQVPNDNYETGAMVCNLFISKVFVGVNPQHEDEFERDRRSINHIDTKRYELKYAEIPSHRLVEGAKKRAEKRQFTLTDNELFLQVETLWSEISHLFEEETVYYATYGYKDTAEGQHNLINQLSVHLNHH